MKSLVRAFCAVIAALAVGAGAARAAEPLHVYDPDGPLPAMREAAAVFGKAHGVDVIVTAGPTLKWLDAPGATPIWCSAARRR